MELTLSQETLLRTVIDLFNGDPVPGHELASELDRHTGTIRNRMYDLKALGLIESATGPKGGYEPTKKAYETLGHTPIASSAETGSIHHNGERVDGIVFEGIKLPNVHNAEHCRAEVYVRGSVRGMHPGDHISIGPLPIAGLEIDGVVVGRAAPKDVLIVDIERMTTATNDPPPSRRSESTPVPMLSDRACDD